MSCVDFGEECNLEVLATLAGTSPGCEVLGSTKTRLNGESVSVTLNLVNNSDSDLKDIHVCFTSPACDISWLDADAGQMGMF